MLHHILVKFNEQVTDKAKIAKEAEEIFSPLAGSNGIKSVKVRLNCIDRPNRWDMVIIIDMEKEALAFYDASEQHKKWKNDYGCYILNKAIFDCED